MQAVDGTLLTDIDSMLTELSRQELRYLNTHGQRLHHAQINSKGAIGCYLSHLNSWKFVAQQTSANNDLDTPYLILEDDVSFPQKCAAAMVDKFALARSRVAEHVPLVLMFELTCIDNCSMYDYFLIPGVFWGTRAYAINGRDAQKLLALPWLPIDGQIDSVMRRFRDEARMSVLCFPLVTASDEGTDIQLDIVESADLPFDR
jgi:GR25 family glycosyltransferase involved in LPS biosynthesis